MNPDSGSRTSDAARGIRLLAWVGFSVSVLSMLAGAYWAPWKDVDPSDPFGSGVEVSHAFYLSIGWALLAGAGLLCGITAWGWLRRHASRADRASATAAGSGVQGIDRG